MIPIADLTAEDAQPVPVQYSYRTLDRQFCFADSRFGDFLRPVLWRTSSARQLFLTTLLADVFGIGPAAAVTNLVPDMHHFSGRGGKDVIPLWREPESNHPNVTEGLLESISSALGRDVTPEDLFAYTYALLSAPTYVELFSDELEVPGPRIPITMSKQHFTEACELGKRLIWLHTFGERFVPNGFRAGSVPLGRARSVVAIPEDESNYPESHSYDARERVLRVGGGVIAYVSPEVREYAVSGLDVVGSWLDYRMKDGAGRRSSPLDEIRPIRWSAAFTEDLLRLLWIIEHTLTLSNELEAILDHVVAGPTLDAESLPTPTDESRRPPAL